MQNVGKQNLTCCSRLTPGSGCMGGAPAASPCGFCCPSRASSVASSMPPYCGWAAWGKVGACWAACCWPKRDCRPPGTACRHHTRPAVSLRVEKHVLHTEQGTPQEAQDAPLDRCRTAGNAPGVSEAASLKVHSRCCVVQASARAAGWAPLALRAVKDLSDKHLPSCSLAAAPASLRRRGMCVW